MEIPNRSYNEWYCHNKENKLNYIKEYDYKNKEGITEKNKAYREEIKKK